MKILTVIMIQILSLSCLAMSKGVGDFVKRAEKGENLTVVFLGGSLTWGANASDPNRTSYRGVIMRNLREQYPKAHWNFVDAAIGGIGSTLGIYRLKRDVMAYNPDLVFLDFTLNDNAKTTDDIALAAYEGIIRHILSNGHSLVFPVILASKDYVTLKDIQMLKRRSSHIAICRQYNLPYADVIAGMRTDYRNGKLDLDQVWPPDLFSEIHPCDYGYKEYARHIWNAFKHVASENLVPVIPDKWLTEPVYANIQRLKLSDLQRLPKNWRRGKPEILAGSFDFLCSRWQDDEVIAANCKRLRFNQFELTGGNPEPLEVKFYGTTVAIFGEATIWSGKYTVSIDGNPVGSYDDSEWAKHFSPSAYMFRMLAHNLDQNQIHTLTVKPEFSSKEPQILKLESICVAGPDRAEIIN